MDGRWVVVVHVLMQFSWAMSLVTPHSCMLSVSVDVFSLTYDVRRGVGILKDWQVQRKTQGMSSIMSRLADVVRRHASRELYMLVKPSADDSLPAVCVCVCAFGKVVCVIEVDVGASGGSWSGEDVLEVLEDLFVSECGSRFVVPSER